MPPQHPRLPKPAGCTSCSLERVGFGYAVPSGPVGARLTFIGEALGYEEAIAGEPFYGSAGGVLSRICTRAGIDRRQTRIANIVSCFPGDTIVEAAAISAAYRRPYDGLFVRVETAVGVLTGTPNHPVLTTRGWVPLGELTEADDLFRGRYHQGLRSCDPYVERPPTRFDQAFDALANQWRSEGIIGGDVDFHGDGSEADIEVVTVDGLLRDRDDLERLQHLRQHVFIVANVNTANLLRSSARLHTTLDFVRRWTAAARSVVSRGQHMFTIDPRSPLPTEPHGVRAITDGDIRGFQQTMQAVLADAELVGERFDAAPIRVEPARVRKVERVRFSGHVYNLATMSEEYTANGFIVHNCRPPNDFLAGAPWEDQAISQCRQYLQPVLDLVPDGGVVVPLGATALTALLHLRGVEGVNVRDFHGCVEQVRRLDGTAYWVVPSFHPSHLQRGAMNLLEVVTQDLRTADRISQQGFVRSSTHLVVDPHPDWFVRWIDDHLARLRADPEGVHLAIDTEFAEKAGGADESEVVIDPSALSPLTRINGANDGVTGWTVPYRTPYKEHFDRLLVASAALGGWIWAWNKYADLTHLRAAGHHVENAHWVDAMWLWHYLQSDLPRGLGFVAPMASDFGAWKHWGKDKSKEGIYAAADGVQTWRVAMWLLRGASTAGIWDVFQRDWHDRDVYVLRPAYEMGVPLNRTALETFHEELQAKLGSVLARLKTTAAQGVLKPKLGYAKKPTSATPPKTVLGTPKKGGAEAKTQYMLEGVRLVERDVEVAIRICDTCHAEGVGPKHRCPQPKKAKKAKVPRKRAGAAGGAGGDSSDRSGSTGISPVAPEPAPTDRSDPRLTQAVRLQRRYFWQLPFNPDAPAQVLAYLAQQGIAAPVDKKKQRATTNKKALKDLQQQHRDDPFFQLQLDWKAVQKVDAVYAVGSLRQLDADNRLHPEFLPKPSTFRDSCQNPNLQNVVADKAGPDGLASGFRRCIEARDGVPPGTTTEQVAAWSTRWT